MFCHVPAKSKLQALRVDVPDAPVRGLLDVSASDPAVSADGKRAAYRSASHLVVVAGDTGKTLRTWPLRGVSCAASWSADGKHFAFGTCGNDDRTGLWVLDVDQDRAVQVAAGPCTMPACSADGAQLACIVQRGKEAEIWAVASKNFWALPPWAPATDRCRVPEGAAELVGPLHRPKGKLVYLDL